MSCEVDSHVKVKLSGSDIKQAKEIAFTRDSRKKKFASTKHWTKDQSTHFIGILGEIAFAKHTGLQLDDRDLVQKGDGGIDFNCPNGTCQVKTTTYNNPALLRFYEHLNDFSTDLAVLAYKESDSVIWLCGWTTKADFEAGAYLTNFGYGSRLVMSDQDLEPMWIK